jgi:shikimate dehydrogenase
MTNDNAIGACRNPHSPALIRRSTCYDYIKMKDPFDFDQPPKLYAVMGNPIGHSKSPLIHTRFGEQCGIRLEYRAIQVDPGGFEQAVGNFRAAGGRGLNVTVPFKVDAWRLADHRSTRAELARAVNTLKFEAEGTIFGDNTDGIGLVRDVGDNLGYTLAGARILVLGAGGAVRGILGPLLEAGPADLTIANRTVERAKDLAATFADHGPVAGCGFEALEGGAFDLVLNGTAASLKGEVPALPAGIFRPGALAYDLMYADRDTAFMAWARRHGAGRVADGLGMLVEQAAESFYLWHGIRPRTAEVIADLRQVL